MRLRGTFQALPILSSSYRYRSGTDAGRGLSSENGPFWRSSATISPSAEYLGSPKEVPFNVESVGSVFGIVLNSSLGIFATESSYVDPESSVMTSVAKVTVELNDVSTRP
jgi:hypothetical protein